MIRFRTPVTGCMASVAPRSGSLPRRKSLVGAALWFAASFLVLLAYSVPARAQAVAPDLGAAGSYTVLGTNEIPTTGTVTCTRSSIDGDVGSTGAEITTVTFCDITGDVDTPVAAGVVSAFGDAYDSVETLNPLCDGPVPTATTALSPGVYCSAAGTTIGEDVTITLDGDADDVWVFRIGTSGLGALTGTGPNLAVVMGGTADACNVYWWTAEGATMTNAAFAGNVLSGAAATMTDTIWQGRALATTDVTLTDSAITGCAAGAEPATIIVEKQTNPPGSLQSFTFTGDAAGTLTDGQQIVVDNLLPGNYSVTESVPVGWELTDIVCNDDDSIGDIGTATANFVLDAGETVTCVFINTELGAMEGTITILKQATPSDTGQSFEFTGDLGTFSLMHGEFVVETRPPGTYAVSEAVPDGWQLDSATCSDGSPVSAIVLEAGENVTCTFTNSIREALRIPIFSQGGMMLIILMMMLMAAAFLRHANRI
jgi:hypothetical protein